jgi:hypothetical protein
MHPPRHIGLLPHRIALRLAQKHNDLLGRGRKVGGAFSSRDVCEYHRTDGDGERDHH